MLYQDDSFVINVKLNFCERQTRCIDDQDKFESVTDTDNKFTECQTPRKKLQSIGISLVISPVTRIYENFKEQYFRCIKSAG